MAKIRSSPDFCISPGLSHATIAFIDKIKVLREYQITVRCKSKVGKQGPQPWWGHSCDLTRVASCGSPQDRGWLCWVFTSSVLTYKSWCFDEHVSCNKVTKNVHTSRWTWLRVLFRHLLTNVEIQPVASVWHCYVTKQSKAKIPNLSSAKRSITAMVKHPNETNLKTSK